jgi:hypothetical protein
MKIAIPAVAASVLAALAACDGIRRAHPLANTGLAAPASSKPAARRKTRA